VIESVGPSVNSGIANLHVALSERFKQLPPAQQTTARSEIIEGTQQVLDNVTKKYLPDLNKGKQDERDETSDSSLEPRQ
jgi:hypothetical protein